MYPRTQSGFSLVETLVAISLLLIIIIGPMTISTTASRSTSFASEQVIAFFLAQEGAELAQRARDDLILENFENSANGGWAEFVDDSSGGAYEDCFTSAGCGLELNTDASGSLATPVECTGTNCRLYFDGSNGRAQYTYDSSSGTQTEFTRRIVMNEIVPDQEVQVRSIVTWRTGSQIEDQEVFVETYLFNVYGN